MKYKKKNNKRLEEIMANCPLHVPGLSTIMHTKYVFTIYYIVFIYPPSAPNSSENINNFLGLVCAFIKKGKKTKDFRLFHKCFLCLFDR